MFGLDAGRAGQVLTGVPATSLTGRSPMLAASLPLVLLLLTLASSAAAAHAGGSVIDFTQTVFVAAGHKQHADLQELQDTVEPFSALRNPVEGTVKVFFEVSFGACA